MTRPFADSVVGYAQAGWSCILPVPVAEKSPPPVGFTGADGADTDPATLVRWATSHGDWSVALRMPDGVIGIDVDHYDKVKTLPDGSVHVVEKRGGDWLAKHEQLWGPLPATWRSSARDLPSGIRFFRVPTQRYATKFGEAIEIVQRHHRYAVAAPSVNMDAGGAPYRWFGPDGEPSEHPPKVEELPELPPEWVKGLREGATEAGPAAAEPARGYVLWAAIASATLPDGQQLCGDVNDAGIKAAQELAEVAAGSRHDATIPRIHHLVHLGAAGHPGVGLVVAGLREQWSTLTSGEGREAEFERMVITSARKAVAVAVNDQPVPFHSCEQQGGGKINLPTPVAPVEGDPEPTPPWSPLQIIGVHHFDPLADTDQEIATAVLERTYPVLRFAYDARTWLRRGPTVWETHDEMDRRTVHDLARMMPRGNHEAEKGSDDLRRFTRRKRMMTTAGRNAVAASMKAAVTGGLHPCALELARLDADPWLIWAGGVAWDLRLSADGPVLADLDPGTPHLQSTGFAPADVPTPRWDAFLESVWPDPEEQAWALRVLSIAFTGEPDAALPILLGPQRRGKSQVVALLMSVLGTYAVAADPRLLASADQAHASIVYALMGRRLAFVDEGPRDGRWAQERLKQLTGGTPLTGNRMRENPVTYDPSHTLVLTANTEPTLTDPAVRARVRLLPCEGDEAAVRATRRAIGDTRGTAWRAEAPGVLAQMMREAGRWGSDRDSTLTAAAPAGIRDRAEVLAAEQDPRHVWLEEEVEAWPEGTSSGDLYAEFVRWCRDRNMTGGMIPTATAWGRALTEAGYPATKDRNGKRRPLRVRPRGGWAPFVVPGSGPGVTSPVTGGDGFALQPVTGKNPGQPVPVTSVTSSFSTSTTTSETHTNKNIQGKGRLPQTGHTAPSKTAPEQQKGPLPVPVTTGHSKADPSDKAAAKIAEAGGETLQLPAAADRAGNVVPLTLAQAVAAVRAAVIAAGALTVDIENTGYPVGHANYALRTVQLGNDAVAVVFDPADHYQALQIRDLIAEAPRLHAHSATADLVPLVDAGLCDERAWARMHDTVIAAKLADPESTGSDPGLKQLSEAVLGDQATAPAAEAARNALFKAGKWLTNTKPDTPLERSGWAQVNPGCVTMIRYAGSDVLDTAALAQRLPWPEPALLERERTVQRITARVAHRGLRIDGEQVDRLHAEHTAAQATAADQVRAYGIDNPGSGPQVAAALAQLGATLPQTATGRPSVAEAVLTPLGRAEGPVGELARAVLDYRHHGTALGLFLEPYRQLVRHGDGRARPTVYTLSADTGRMSCVRPNLQQVPREGGFRACITADPGQLLISADFSSVEVRVMAALSQDPHLLRMIAEGVDLHSVVAAQVFGPDYTKADRYVAKRGVFGWAYGGGIPTLAVQVGTSESVMAAVVDSLALVAPRYVEWGNELKQLVRRGATQMPTYAGRVIHLAKREPHKAPNYAIQGTARELLVDALLVWDRTRWAGTTVLPVHDEIVAVVPAEEAEEATAELVRCMTTELYGVPIAAEADAPSFEWKDAA